jgi:hypothetical protein
MRRYRARKKHNDATPQSRNLRAAFDATFDAASAAERRALAHYVVDTVLRAAPLPVATPEAAHKPDARQIDLEEAIARAASIEASAPPAKPAKGAGIWHGPMPVVIVREAEAQCIDAARLADLWERAKVEKKWVAGQTTLSNLTKAWRRWLASSQAKATAKATAS